MLGQDVWDGYEASDVDIIRDALRLKGGISLSEIISVTGVQTEIAKDIITGFLDQQFIYYDKQNKVYRWKT